MPILTRGEIMQEITKAAASAGTPTAAGEETLQEQRTSIRILPQTPEAGKGVLVDNRTGAIVGHNYDAIETPCKILYHLRRLRMREQGYTGEYMQTITDRKTGRIIKRQKLIIR